MKKEMKKWNGDIQTRATIGQSAQRAGIILGLPVKNVTIESQRDITKGKGRIMTIEKAFAKFYQRIQPSESRLAKARKRCDYIKSVLNNDREFSPRKFYYSGSYAKNTCVKPLNDIDLVPYYDIDMCLKNNGEFYAPSTIIGKFHYRMEQMYGHHFYIRRQKRSIGIISESFNVDVVPVFWDGNKDHYAFIPDRERKEWILTSIPLHTKLLKSRDKSYRPYGKTIRLMKAWKAEKSVPLKGFALELLVIEALDQYGISSYPWRNVHSVMEYVQENQFEEIIWFDDYISSDQIEIEESPIMIVDPVNPENNVTLDISERNKGRILTKFAKAYKQANWAIQAEERGDNRIAKERWRYVFGDKFPLR